MLDVDRDTELTRPILFGELRKKHDLGLEIMLQKSGFIDELHLKTGMKLFLLYKSSCMLLTIFSQFSPRHAIVP